MPHTSPSTKYNMNCQLCETEFKTNALLNKHQTRKTACVSSQKVLEQMKEKDDKLSEMKQKMDMSEEQSDMFRKLHVRSQKQLAAWRKEHKKCDVTLAKEALEEPEYPPGPRTTVSVEEFFNNPGNFSSPEEAAANATPTFSGRYNNATSIGGGGVSQPRLNSEGGTSFSFKQPDTNSGGNNGSSFSFRPKTMNMPTPKLNQPDSIKPPTSWNSWSSDTNRTRQRTNNNTFSSTTTTNNGFGGNFPWDNDDNGPKFGTPEWTRQFQSKFGRKGQLTRLPNGQVIDTANMTTTNTTTTNITNNIININVKLCAPGFESINMSDSRGLHFSMAKKQRIADHLQKLLDIMMDDEEIFE